MKSWRRRSQLCTGTPPFWELRAPPMPVPSGALLHPSGLWPGRCAWRAQSREDRRPVGLSGASGYQAHPGRACLREFTRAWTRSTTSG